MARGISFRGALRQDPSTAGASQQKRLIGSFAEGAPGESGTFRQAVLHRCACGCRFRWPELAERVEVREAGAVALAISLVGIVARAERATTLAELEAQATHDDDGSDPPPE